MNEPSDSVSVSVSRRIPAPTGAVFAVLAEPRRHLELDGSGMLRGTDFTGSVTAVGETFVMRMHHGPLGDYEMINHVVELEQDRRIAWKPESGNGHPDAGAQGQQHRHWVTVRAARHEPSRSYPRMAKLSGSMLKLNSCRRAWPASEIRLRGRKRHCPGPRASFRQWNGGCATGRDASATQVVARSVG